jgi:serine/threonine-protein kinase
VLLAGSTIAGRFELVRLLGEGGMGEVWAATHIITRKAVALKFLKEGAARSPAAVRRFLREARAASAVRHVNVVAIHDVLELDGGVPVMVMDLLVGESFGSRLARERLLPIAEVARIMVPVFSALGTAHALGIVHRDLKPDNIFLERAGDDAIVPKVLDFGIAKLSATEGAAAQSAELTSTGSVMGTFLYMAPEQVFGEKDVDQRADVWALGVILYEALSGMRPIAGENFGQVIKAIMTHAIQPLAAVAPNVPQEVTALVERMLSLDRAGRPQDLREPFELLKRYTDERATSFAGARAPESDSTLVEGVNLPYAPTESSGPLALPLRTRSFSGRTGWVVAATVVGVLAALGSSLPWLKKGNGSATSSASPTSVVVPSERATSPNVATGIASLAAAASAPPAESAVTSATAAPSASSAPFVSVSQRPSLAKAPGAVRANARGIKVEAAATASAHKTGAELATKPPASGSQRLPGGIASAAPF